MSQRIIVAGTDTGIGKTVFAAGLADMLGAMYWKPVQAETRGREQFQGRRATGGTFR